MSPISAPVTYHVPPRTVVAVEHPMVIKNIDRALSTFESSIPLSQILEEGDYDACLPLYLRHRDRTSAPILSHNTVTDNIVLKITLPRRTGRKRKRGSSEPFLSESDESVQAFGGTSNDTASGILRSHSRLDNAKLIRRSLKDNLNTCEIEAIGSIHETHRYRGIADFHQSTEHEPFMNKFLDTIGTTDPQKLRSFSLDPSRGVQPKAEMVPPPMLTDFAVPFNWGYRQNPHIRVQTNEATGEQHLTNISNPKQTVTKYLANDATVLPQGPPDNITHPERRDTTYGMVDAMHRAFSERPIWTRRALLNRIGDVHGLTMFKNVVHYVGYQFRGGPWRDSIIKYGVDPRIDPSYRFYQTLFYKIYTTEGRPKGESWKDFRSEYHRRKMPPMAARGSHLFDGRSFGLDGKIWQLCDITDPLLRNLIDNASVRDTCDIIEDGWFQNGAYAKIKAVMRTKLSAIQHGIEVSLADFKDLLEYPDFMPGKKRPHVAIPQFSAGRVRARRRAKVTNSIAGGDGSAPRAKRRKVHRVGSSVATGENTEGGDSLSMTPGDSATQAVAEVDMSEEEMEDDSGDESDVPQEGDIVGSGDGDVDMEDEEEEFCE